MLSEVIRTGGDQAKIIEVIKKTVHTARLNFPTLKKHPWDTTNLSKDLSVVSLIK